MGGERGELAVERGGAFGAKGKFLVESLALSAETGLAAAFGAEAFVECGETALLGGESLLGGGGGFGFARELRFGRASRCSRRVAISARIVSRSHSRATDLGLSGLGRGGEDGHPALGGRLLGAEIGEPAGEAGALALPFFAGGEEAGACRLQLTALFGQAARCLGGFAESRDGGIARFAPGASTRGSSRNSRSRPSMPLSRTAAPPVTEPPVRAISPASVTALQPGGRCGSVPARWEGLRRRGCDRAAPRRRRRCRWRPRRARWRCRGRRGGRGLARGVATTGRARCRGVGTWRGRRWCVSGGRSPLRRRPSARRRRPADGRRERLRSRCRSAPGPRSTRRQSRGCRRVCRPGRRRGFPARRRRARRRSLAVGCSASRRAAVSPIAALGGSDCSRVQPVRWTAARSDSIVSSAASRRSRPGRRRRRFRPRSKAASSAVRRSRRRGALGGRGVRRVRVRRRRFPGVVRAARGGG